MHLTDALENPENSPRKSKEVQGPVPGIEGEEFTWWTGARELAKQSKKVQRSATSGVRFKTGSGTVMRSTLRAVPAAVQTLF